MSYLPSARGPTATGDVVPNMLDQLWFSVLTDEINNQEIEESQDCLNAANAQTADMFAKRLAVAKDWQPTGYWTPTELQLVVNWGLQMLRAAGNVVDQAIGEPQLTGARDALTSQRASVLRQEGRAIEFTDALNAAAAKNVDIIESTSLKRWVIGAMAEAEASIVAVSYVGCMQPWFVDAIATFMAVFNAIMPMITAIGHAVLVVGQAVLKIPDTLSTIVTVSLWGGAALGAYWLWTKFGKPKFGKRNPARRTRRRRR